MRSFQVRTANRVNSKKKKKEIWSISGLEIRLKNIFGDCVNNLFFFCFSSLTLPLPPFSFVTCRRSELLWFSFQIICFHIEISVCHSVLVFPDDKLSFIIKWRVICACYLSCVVHVRPFNQGRSQRQEIKDRDNCSNFIKNELIWGDRDGPGPRGWQNFHLKLIYRS